MSPDRLTILMLGEFQITYGETRLTASLTPRLQSFIAYLLLHRDKTTSRQQMAFHFWPDSTDRQARTNLRKALHRLRQLFSAFETFVDLDGSTLIWRQAALASQLLGTELESTVADTLYRATEGNPLFTVEMARAGLRQVGAALPQ